MKRCSTPWRNQPPRTASVGTAPGTTATTTTRGSGLPLKTRTIRCRHRIRIYPRRILEMGAILLVLATASSPAVVPVEVLDLESCYAALSNGDMDADNKVDREEYVQFLQLYRPGIVPQSVTNFADLPLPLQSNFYSLACACRNDDDSSNSNHSSGSSSSSSSSSSNQTDDCCLGDNAHLPAAGNGKSNNNNNKSDNEVLTEAEQSRLFSVCFFTNSELNRLGAAGTTTTTTTTATTMTIVGQLSVSYTIVVAISAAMVEDYDLDLVAAMDDLAMQVVGELPRELRDPVHRLLIMMTTKRRQALPLLRRQQRRQQEEVSGLLQVYLPTSLESRTDKGGFTMEPSATYEGVYDGNGPCPADLGHPSTDRCEEIVALVQVLSSTPSIEGDLLDAVQSSLSGAILAGRLQESLQRTRPSSVATILSGQPTTLVVSKASDPTTHPSSPPRVEDNGMAGGAIAAIIIFTLAMVVVIGALFVTHRQGETFFKYMVDRNDNTLTDTAPIGKPCVSDTQPPVPVESHTTYVGTRSSISQTPLLSLAGKGVNTVTEAVLPDALHLLSCTSPNAYVDLKKEPRKEPVPIDGLAEDYSPDKAATSDQSDSGWSSDVGNSSIGSADTEGAEASLGGDEDENRMLKIVDLQRIERRGVISCDSPDHGGGVTSLADLAAAIMVGDWAAVGTSAVVLASYDSETSTDGSFFSASQTGGSSNSIRAEEWKSQGTTISWQRAKDASKAVELDKLIEQGDWEAVIRAAARFEAEQNTTYGNGSSTGEYYDPSQTTASMLGDDEDDNSEDVETMEGTSPPIPPVKETATTGIRSDVMELLRQVVPEEMDNVDEMLLQFEGREEDLIETLQAMEIPQRGAEGHS